MSETDSPVLREFISRLRREEPEMGHLPAAIRFKRDLVEQLGLQEAFKSGRQALSIPGTDHLRRRRLRGLLDYGRSEGSAYEEIWVGGNDFTDPSPRIIGEGDRIEYRGTSRTAYLTCIENALVRGRSSLVLVGDDALFDFEHDELTRFVDQPLFDPFVFHAEGEFLWTMEPDDAGPWIEEAFMLSGSHAHDFGHWILEYLPKLAPALMAGLSPMPVLVDELIPATHVESLKLLLPRGFDLIRLPHLAARRVGRLWCAPAPMYRGFYPPVWDVRTWLGMAMNGADFAREVRYLKRLAGDAIVEPTGWDRIFLARRPSLKKRLVNAEEVEAAAEARAFRVLYPESLSFRDQLRAAHHARHLVAPEGSNSFLAFFAAPGARLCTLSPPNTYPLADVNAPLMELGVELTIFTGPVVSCIEGEEFWADYRIDAAEFGRFLDGWLE